MSSDYSEVLIKLNNSKMIDINYSKVIHFMLILIINGQAVVYYFVLVEVHIFDLLIFMF